MCVINKIHGKYETKNFVLFHRKYTLAHTQHRYTDLKNRYF